MEKLKIIEKTRLDLYEKSKKNTLFAFLFTIPTIGFGAVGFSIEPLFFIGAVIFFIGVVTYFLKDSENKKKFRDTIKNNLISCLLEEQLDDVKYDPKGSIPVKRIVDTRMVKGPDKSSAEDYIKGSYKGVGFEVCDIDLKERVVTTDGKGNTHVRYDTYFKGRWFIYKFEKTFSEELRIIEGKRAMFNTKKLVKTETESIIFNKKFDVYATSKQYGFYHISSSMIEKFLKLEEMHRGTILYYYTKNELHIGINDRKDYMEITLKTPITREALKPFMADIEIIPAIINELRLDSTKFKN